MDEDTRTHDSFCNRTECAPKTVLSKCKEADEQVKKWGFQLAKHSLGQGAYGMVFPVTHMGTGEVQAVKYVKIRKWQQYLLERGAYLRLKHYHHPNVLHCLEDWVASDYKTAVQLFPLGTLSLFELLRKKSVRWPQQAFQICQDIAQGISHLHFHSILHRDIKTDNVIMFWEPSHTSSDSYTMSAKIGDFSLATLVNSPEQPQSAGMATCRSNWTPRVHKNQGQDNCASSNMALTVIVTIAVSIAFAIFQHHCNTLAIIIIVADIICITSPFIAINMFVIVVIIIIINIIISA